MSQLGHLEGVPQSLIRGLMITMLNNHVSVRPGMILQELNMWFAQMQLKK